MKKAALAAVTAEHPVVSRKFRGVDGSVDMPVPAVILEHGSKSATRFMRFFTKLRSAHTRDAYMRDVLLFFSWLQQRGLTDGEAVEPMLVDAYRDQLFTYS